MKTLKLKNPFVGGTGLMGGTESGQKVNAENIHFLPPGSVVRLGDNTRVIHLHDDLWLVCNDGMHCYDRVENLAWRLDDTAEVCHLAPSNRIKRK
jgi:hypothetical protein